VLTVGVDLAAEPEGTAVAQVEWLAGRAVVREVLVSSDDSALLAALSQADRAGIDCPLGWPDAFIQFITAHQRGQVPVPPNIADRGWRRSLSMRVTDLVVRQETRITPLSVSADRVGHVAMRCAVLLTLFAQQGQAADRDGSAKIAEVYPAASLKIWGLPWRGYKRPGDTQILNKLADELLDAAPWLELGDADFVCRRRHDALDAVVAALTPGQLTRTSPCAPARPQRHPPPAPKAGSRSRYPAH
jgi:predicted nuclease with RNAse H fold